MFAREAVLPHHTSVSDEHTLEWNHTEILHPAKVTAYAFEKVCLYVVSVCYLELFHITRKQPDNQMFCLNNGRT